MMTINGKKYKVTDIMRPCICIPNTATLRETLERMIEEKRNSLVVVDENGALVGMVNAVDIIKAVLPDYLEESAIAARFANIDLLQEDAQRVENDVVTTFMEHDIPTITRDGNIIEAAAIASHQGTGRIVVIDEERKPIGVLTRTELKQIIGATIGITGDRFISES